MNESSDMELARVLAGVQEMSKFAGVKVSDATARGHFNETPLHIVATWGDIHAGKLLLDAGADPNAHGEDGETPLHRAIGQRQIEFARLLLERGALKSALDDSGLTPLDVASICQYEDGIKLLTEK